jgi:hypothetical protein
MTLDVHSLELIVPLELMNYKDLLIGLLNLVKMDNDHRLSFALLLSLISPLPSLSLVMSKFSHQHPETFFQVSVVVLHQIKEVKLS